MKGPIHDTFALGDWELRCPLAIQPPRFTLGNQVYTPGALAVAEQFRKAYLSNVEPACKTDVFVLNLGESPKRDITKIGGLPYRSAALPWPRIGKTPMTFVCQFCFADSLDLFESLPGEVLLMFAKDDMYDGEADHFHFEWVQLGDFALASSLEPGTPDWTFLECFGTRHRTVDYTPTAELVNRISKSGWKVSAESLCALLTLKVGGLPPWLDPNDAIVRDCSKKVFLGCLPTIQPDVSGERFPWLNIDEPYTLLTSMSDPTLTLSFYNFSCLYLFLTELGDVEVVCQWHYD